MFLDTQIKNLYKALGKNIKEARLKKNITQIKFAELLNISRASLVNIEVGRQRPPLHLLYFIAKLLDIELIILLPKEESFEGNIIDHVVLRSIQEQSEGVSEVEEKLIGFVKQQSSKPNEIKD